MKKIVSSVLIACCGAVATFWPQQASSHETLTTTVLFDREIVRVLNKHCVMCHVEGGPSFPLEKSIEVSARTPDGGTEVLLFAKDVPMDWPTPYIFRTPVLLRRGTEVSVTAHYTNPGVARRPGGIRLTVSRYHPPSPASGGRAGFGG